MAATAAHARVLRMTIPGLAKASSVAAVPLPRRQSAIVEAAASCARAGGDRPLGNPGTVMSEMARSTRSRFTIGRGVAVLVAALLLIGVFGLALLLGAHAIDDRAWSRCQELIPPAASGYHVNWERRFPPRYVCVYTDRRGRIIAERRT